MPSRISCGLHVMKSFRTSLSIVIPQCSSATSASEFADVRSSQRSAASPSASTGSSPSCSDGRLSSISWTRRSMCALRSGSVSCWRRSSASCMSVYTVSIASARCSCACSFDLRYFIHAGRWCDEMPLTATCSAIVSMKRVCVPLMLYSSRMRLRS